MTRERAESFLSFNVNILCNLFDKHQNQQRDALICMKVNLCEQGTMGQTENLSLFVTFNLFFFYSCFYKLYIRFLF